MILYSYYFICSEGGIEWKFISMLLVRTLEKETTSWFYERSFDLLASIFINRNMSLYLCCKVGFLSIPGGILFVLLLYALCGFPRRSWTVIGWKLTDTLLYLINFISMSTVSPRIRLNQFSFPTLNFNTSKSNTFCITRSFGMVLISCDLISFHRACALLI